MKKTLFFLVLILSAQYHFGQEIISISKNDLLMKASEQNLQIQLANRETNLAEADLLQTRAMYLLPVSAAFMVGLALSKSCFPVCQATAPGRPLGRTVGPAMIWSRLISAICM